MISRKKRSVVGNRSQCVGTQSKESNLPHPRSSMILLSNGMFPRYLPLFLLHSIFNSWSMASLLLSFHRTCFFYNLDIFCNSILTWTWIFKRILLFLYCTHYDVDRSSKFSIILFIIYYIIYIIFLFHILYYIIFIIYYYIIYYNIVS